LRGECDCCREFAWPDGVRWYGPGPGAGGSWPQNPVFLTRIRVNASVRGDPPSPHGAGLVVALFVSVTIGLALFVTQTAKDFEDLAPGRKHPSASSFVFVHGQHEFGLRLGVFALTGGWVDESASTAQLTSVRGTRGLFRCPTIDPFPGLVEGIREFLGFLNLT